MTGGRKDRELQDVEGAPLLYSSVRPQPEQAKDPLPSKDNRFLYTLTLLSALGGFLFGYDTGVVGGAMLVIREDWKDLTDQGESQAVSITMLACLIAVVFSGELTERYGRQPVIIAGSLIFALGAVLMAIAEGELRFEMLLVGRFVVGIAVGFASMAVPMYIAEAAPPESRGALVTLNNVFITGGQFIANVVDALLSKYDYPHGWRYMLGLGVVPAVIQFGGFLFMPESPRWLAVHRSEDAAREVLARIRGTEEVDAELEEIAQGAHAEAATASAFTALRRTPALRRALRLGTGLQLVQQLSGINTVMYYCPTIFVMAGFSDPTTAIWLTAGASGVGCVACCAAIPVVDRAGRRLLTLSSLAVVVVALLGLGLAFFFSLSHSPPCRPPPLPAPSLAAIPAGPACSAHSHCFDCVADTACGFCAPSSSAAPGHCLPGNQSAPSPLLRQSPDASALAHCFPPGATPTADGGASVNGGGASVNGGGASGWSFEGCPGKDAGGGRVGGYAALVAVAVYLAAFQPGMGPMPWAINAEIYPLHVRSAAVGVATLCNWGGNLLVSSSFLGLAQLLGPHGAFWCYAALAAAGWLWLFRALPETAGKSLEEIQTLFAGEGDLPRRSHSDHARLCWDTAGPRSP